jgi:hypothetical protein
MNTLREIGTFVGLAPVVSMRGVGDRVPLLSSSERTSMSAMMLGLQNLPSISLEVEIVGESSGEVPFAPEFHVHPSNGVIIDTRMIFLQNGRFVATDLPPIGEFAAPLTLGAPGVYEVQVLRTGIPNTGITVLKKVLEVRATAQPAPPRPRPAPPVIAVQSKGDGGFVVSGSGFLPNATVHIRVVDGPFGSEVFFTDTTNAEGKLLGFSTGKICQRPGQLFFSANDGRSDPSDHTGALFSNTVTTSCPA